MNRRHLLHHSAALVALAALPAWAATAPAPKVVVYKTPTCGCCGAWVTHMRSAGFAVDAIDVKDAGVERKRLGMPEQFGSCHTASVGGYVIEGHVPANEVKRLLASKPKALGLAVPGMPLSSPGMDVPGRKDPYQVLLINPSGQSSIYANYPK